MTVLGSPLRPYGRSPFYIPFVGKWGGAFSPSDLFQSGDILLWYDPSDLSTMFKDTAGTQPVTADGDSVALMLDKGQWGGKTLEQVLAAQPELANATLLDKRPATGGTVSRSGGVITFANSLSGLSTGISEEITGLTVGRTYIFQGRCRNVSGSASVLSLRTASGGGGSSLAISSNFTSSFSTLKTIWVATQTSVHITYSAAVGAVFEVDEAAHSFKEIPGYHRVQATGTSMPKYKTDGTLHWLLYDGTDDGHATGTITWGTDEVAVCAGVTKSSDAATGMFAELSVAQTSNNGTFNMLAPSQTGSNSYRFSSKGTATADAGTGVFQAAPDTAVLTGQGDISADLVSLRRNGSVVQTASTDQGTGNFGSYVLYFGRRGGSSLPFNGREYQTVIRSRLLSTTELSSLETFIAAKTGVTL